MTVPSNALLRSAAAAVGSTIGLLHHDIPDLPTAAMVGPWPGWFKPVN